MLRQRLQHSNGFTLLDLLSAISIMLIITSVAVPSFSYLSKKTAQQTTVNDLMRLLNFARQAAVNERSSVVVCPSADENSCDENWSFPLMVFVDSDDNKSRGTQERLLITRPSLASQQQLNWRSLHRNFISFKEDGTTGYQNGRLYYCDLSADDKHRAQLVVYRTGRTRVAQSLLSGCGA
ncbi:GspH/FimT family pseudopilin [Teredinibacter purpureus]|uniref:GspH/FimT family pseudopilin n=1 Tax=Teredinibacter purpureus TaxID=2731756 RepID=UPI0005F82A26|nr:GspH/FimT family pseudopilin [Teredinibacter purpureus]